MWLPSKFAYCLHREDLRPISLIWVDIRTYIHLPRCSMYGVYMNIYIYMYDMSRIYPLNYPNIIEHRRMH